MNKDKLSKLLSDIDIDIDIDDITTIDELDEAVQEYINGEEVIYYAKAMDYLQENDNSLSQSMELASEFGYEVQNINSELLATLLLQHNMNEDYQEIRDEAEELLEE